MKRPRRFVALALLLALPVLACGGSGADIPALATAAADVAPASSFNVVARNTRFDTDTIVATADQEVIISLENQDGALHNIAIYSEEGGDAIFRGELFTGPETMEYRFDAPPPSVYYFRCDAHPEMEGAFIAR